MLKLCDEKKKLQLREWWKAACSTLEGRHGLLFALVQIGTRLCRSVLELKLESGKLHSGGWCSCEEQ